MFADNESGGGKRLSRLKDNINDILHGSVEEKQKLENTHFFIADTPDFMKELDPPIKSKRTEVNAVKTAFGADSLKGEKVIYLSKKITPEQELFIGRTNSANNLSEATPSLSTQSPEKSSDISAKKSLPLFTFS
ncbi:MAG: hypothetical protein Ta2G_00100 [Termitinemataceae bacterium]|nr:MAG: hypothetical protein Ta2G_00100 [Termitinemataceae bacterium]